MDPDKYQQNRDWGWTKFWGQIVFFVFVILAVVVSCR